jgi:hypothetical protein
MTSPSGTPLRGGSAANPASISLVLQKKEERIKQLEQLIATLETKMTAQKVEQKKTTEKVLSKTTESAMVARLAQSPKRPAYQPPKELEKTLANCKPIPADVREAMVSRLCTDDIATRRQRAEEREQAEQAKVFEMVKNVKLSPQVLSETAQRLCNKELENRQTKIAKLRGELQTPAKMHRRKLSPERVQDLGKRLHDKSQSDKEEMMNALRAELCADPPRRVLSPEQLKAMGDRLCSPKK